MDTGIIVAIITGAFTFAGVVLTVIAGNKKTEKQIKAQSDLTIYRLEELEKKQDKHNGVIERMFQAEEKIAVLGERQDNLIRRVDDIEHKIIKP